MSTWFLFDKNIYVDEFVTHIIWLPLQIIIENIYIKANKLV